MAKNQDVRALPYRNLQKLASELNVYEVGMKKGDLISAIEAVLGSKEEVSNPSEERENALESNLEARPQEDRSDGEESEETITFVSVHDREGKILPLEVSINKQRWVGDRIEVPAKLAGEVERLLKDGHYLFVKG